MKLHRANCLTVRTHKSYLSLNNTVSPVPLKCNYMKTRLEVSISWCNSVISGPLVPLKWSRQVSHSLRPTHRVWVLSVTRGLLLGWGCLVFVSYHPGADTHTHTHTHTGRGSSPLFSKLFHTDTLTHTHIQSYVHAHTG